MRNAPLQTRLRAWYLRTFKGRSTNEAGWTEEAPLTAGPPRSFELGELRLDVNPRGLKSAGANPRSMVYRVQVSGASRPQSWSSSYGFEPREGSARIAADTALDELAEIAWDRGTWWRRVTAGMSEEEAAAMEDSPAGQLDQRAADWVGPELEPWRERRASTGSWLAEDP